MERIVFTDLDGTLLDDNYNYDSAKESLSLLKKENIPLVICTSKTRDEIESYRKEIGNEDPFISENGGAIFIPKGYFSSEYEYKEKGEYNVIELGTSYEDLKKIMEKIDERYGTTSFYELSAKELSKEAGMTIEDAKEAKNREYDIVFKIDDEINTDEILDAIEEEGLNYTEGGNYYHVMGDNDKGKAVRKLIDLYEKEYNDVETIGLGDANNDIPMLREVDKDFMVNGPEQWNEIVKKEIK